MKPLFVVLIAAFVLSAQTLTIKESPGRNTRYEIATESSAKSLSSAKGSRYFLYGDPAQERRSTGKLIVGFEHEIDVAAFAAKWKLENPKRISRMFVTWVFDNVSPSDDLTLAAAIGAQEEGIRFAKPEWATSRTVK